VCEVALNPLGQAKEMERRKEKEIKSFQELQMA
jgi:hypothetical protein